MGKWAAQPTARHEVCELLSSRKSTLMLTRSRFIPDVLRLHHMRSPAPQSVLRQVASP